MKHEPVEQIILTFWPSCRYVVQCVNVKTVSFSFTMYVCGVMYNEGGTHELSLVHEINALAAWCGKFTTSVPTQLVLCFKSQLSAKSSTSAVRTAYVHCMTTTFNGRSLYACIDVCLSVSLFVCLFLCMLALMSVCLSVSLSVYFFVCLH